jgi:molybdopterin synthase catalytic subunit
MKQIFQPGPISAQHIAESLEAHRSKTEIGAHSLFLGQVRADTAGASRVAAIEYTAHERMALEAMHAIREDLFAKYKLTCLHVAHSLGRVDAGALCLMVFASSRHRADAQAAVQEAVERIKKELPIWGKEILSNATHQWKENTHT